ncbi:chymotrypsinogen B [Brachionus plicatilis]|uniref:Chymotrypsinogen B n=1 Tax=Brachionus plicatilis TaxID=10195 RepID=A0A3M7QM29_BRAPC|nr:chymotrypsinogen B [Brachionus plicatilis]
MVLDSASTANKLQQVAVPIKSNSDCRYFRLDQTQFCAGNTDRFNVRDSCQGDSGGPLVTKEESKYVLAGIVSFGGPSCDGNGVYTNVYSFMDWIQQTIASH